MPRMSKKRKEEWAFFLNDRGRIAYNALCEQVCPRLQTKFPCCGDRLSALPLQTIQPPALIALRRRKEVMYHLLQNRYPAAAFRAVARFILRGEYSINAKLLYALLLGRTQLSQKSGWVSEDGDVYVIYTIRQIANDLNRSERTVKAALTELENAGLIIRVRQGWNRANRIFLQLPDEVQLLFPSPEGKFCPMDGLESSPCMGQNLPISKKEKKKTDSSQNNRRENARRCFGQYQNVFLLDSELAELQWTYPDQYEDYINRLSAYMASSGKHYTNHYATIRKWLDEDSKPKPGKNYDYTETYEEGECL